MKVLITSGGTKIKIDLVRSITNMSRGTFGSQICDSFWHKLNSNAHANNEIADEVHQITFFMAKNSKMPTAEHMASEFFDNDTHLNRYIEYDTFDDYRTKLTDLLKKEKFDIIVLAAAVSDYGVENIDTIRLLGSIPPQLTYPVDPSKKLKVVFVVPDGANKKYKNAPKSYLFDYIIQDIGLPLTHKNNKYYGYINNLEE